MGGVSFTVIIFLFVFYSFISFLFISFFITASLIFFNTTQNFAQDFTVKPMKDPLFLMNCFFLASFKIFALSLSFDSLIFSCLGVNLFGFILLGIIELLECVD